MSTITATDSGSTTTSVAPTTARWAWWGVAAGILGVVATLATNVTVSGKHIGPDAISKIHGGTYHVGGALGYLAVAALLVLAGAWRTRVLPDVPHSIAARVVPDGLTAASAALALGYGWKLAMGLYLPGGLNEGQFSDSALWVYFVLNDFGAFIGWLGVVVAAGAMVVLGLRDRVVPRWVGLISLIPVLAVLGMSLGGAIAGFPGVVGPLWMVIAFGGIALQRNRRSGGR
jgi:uncharacterized membrane protein YhaH (DUF805 family)